MIGQEVAALGLRSDSGVGDANGEVNFDLMPVIRNVNRIGLCDRFAMGASPAIAPLSSGPSGPKLANRVTQCGWSILRRLNRAKNPSGRDGLK